MQTLNFTREGICGESRIMLYYQMKHFIALYSHFISIIKLILSLHIGKNLQFSVSVSLDLSLAWWIIYYLWSQRQTDWFEPQLHHLIVPPWACCIMSLSLNFLILNGNSIFHSRFFKGLNGIKHLEKGPTHSKDLINIDYYCPNRLQPSTTILIPL